MRFALSTSFLLLIAALLGGCGGGQEPETYPVSGTVVFRDGAPAKGVTVKFRTTDRTPPFTASGKTDDQGSFQLNAAEGENAVVVVPTFPRDTDQMTPAQRDRAMNPIDPMFLDYERSGLKHRVASDPAANRFDITIWPPRQ